MVRTQIIQIEFYILIYIVTSTNNIASQAKHYLYQYFIERKQTRMTNV